MFGRVSDPPVAFRVDMRGKSPRTDRDYAGLAASYLALPKSARRKAAADWSGRFGRDPQRWRMDLKRAKRFIVFDASGDRLTDDGWLLVFGEEALSQLAWEQDIDSADTWLEIMETQRHLVSTKRLQQWAETEKVRRYARDKGVPVEAVLVALIRQQRDKVDSWYS